MSRFDFKSICGAKLPKINSNSLGSVAQIAIIGLGALVYSINVSLSPGADFGIYFVGARFSNDQYPLYSGFFDHKGPFTYLILKGVIFILGFSIISASVFAFVTALLFLILLRKLGTTRSNTVNFLITIFLTLFTVSQNANAIINFIAAILLMICYLIFKDTQFIPSSLALLSFSLCISLMIFTAPWSVFLAIYLIFVLLWRISSVRRFLFLLYFISTVIMVFEFHKLILGISLNDYVYSNYVFNFFEYSKFIQIESGMSFFSSVFLQQRLIIFSAIPFMFLVYILLVLRTSTRSYVYINVFILTIMALASGSDHVHYAIWLVVALCLSISHSHNADLSNSVAQFIAGVCAAALLFTPTLYSRAVSVSCALKLNAVDCKDPYKSIKDAVGASNDYHHEFFGNDPWPYLLTNQTPGVNFASNFLLKSNQAQPRRMRYYWVPHQANYRHGLGAFIKLVEKHPHYSGTISIKNWIGFRIS